MAAPVYAAAGDGIDTDAGLTFAIPYPAGISAGDLLVAHVMCQFASAVATPSGWTLLAGPHAMGTIRKIHAFVRQADGTESGSASFPDDGDRDMSGRMYRFTGWLADATMANNFEDIDFAGTTSDTIADVAVTTSAADRLAVNLVFVSDDNALDSFTGETGGDWTEAVAEYTSATLNPDIAHGLQTATMASADTIDGGTDVMAASDPWLVIGFAILPSGGAPATPVYRLKTRTVFGVGR